MHIIGTGQTKLFKRILFLFIDFKTNIFFNRKISTG